MGGEDAAALTHVCGWGSGRMCTHAIPAVSNVVALGARARLTGAAMAKRIARAEVRCSRLRCRNASANRGTCDLRSLRGRVDSGPHAGAPRRLRCAHRRSHRHGAADWRRRLRARHPRLRGQRGSAHGAKRAKRRLLLANSRQREAFNERRPKIATVCPLSAPRCTAATSRHMLLPLPTGTPTPAWATARA